MFCVVFLCRVNRGVVCLTSSATPMERALKKLINYNILGINEQLHWYNHTLNSKITYVVTVKVKHLCPGAGREGYQIFYESWRLEIEKIDQRYESEHRGLIAIS